MSNGLSGEIQYIDNYRFDQKSRIENNKRIFFLNYVNSYIEKTCKQVCTCSSCKASAIKPVSIKKGKEGVEEVWKCQNCGREVSRIMLYTELSYRANVDKNERRT